MDQQQQNHTISVDVDGVICDLIGSVLRKFNERTGQHIVAEQIRTFDLRVVLKDSWTIAHDILAEPGFARDVKPYPGAINGIEQLRTLGRVVFVTSPFHSSPTWSYERSQWLMHFAKARRRDIVHIDDKTLIRSDLLIDDATHQLEAWIKTGRPAIRVVRPWNSDAPGVAAQNWEEIVLRSKSILSDTSSGA